MSKKIKYIKIFLFFISILFIFTGCVKKEIKKKILTINKKNIKIEIVNSSQKQILGLSNRSNLCLDCGMLFVFKKKSKYSFWMKNMKFPLDIIWINNKKIVYIINNAPIPYENIIPSYIPPTKSDMVLEVNSGFVKNNNIKIGDIIKIL